MQNLKHFIYALLVLCLLAAPLSAETVDDVVKKHIDARGGKNWTAVQTMKITGTFTGFSIPGPCTIFKQKPNLYHFDGQWGDKPVVIGTNGDFVWTVNPWFDAAWPIVVGAWEENAVLQEAELFTPFFNYKAAGHTVELLGREKLEGLDVIKLKLTRKNKNEETWYLDAETYLEVQRMSLGADFGYRVPMTSVFDDFRNVDGVMIPHVVEQEFSIRHRVLEIDKVELNPDVKADIFAMPVPPGMKVLQPMAGEWKVKQEVKGRDGKWVTIKGTSATVKALSHGALLRMEMTRPFGFISDYIFHWSYDHPKKVYRVTLFDSLRASINVLEGVFKDGVLTLDNTGTKTTYIEENKDVYSRYILSDITDKGFVIQEAVSRDPGKNWRNGIRMTFQKKATAKK